MNNQIPQTIGSQIRILPPKIESLKPLKLGREPRHRAKQTDKNPFPK